MKKLILMCLAAAFLQACAPETADKYNTADDENDAVSLLNEHQYDKAIWLIENRQGTVPDDQQLRFVLAQAYLGRAGLEPLAFASRVAAAQPDTEESRSLFGKCPNDKWSSLNGADVKCIVKRVYLQAPDADNVDLARARELFRRSYPDPAAAPAWANTLIGVTEAVSVIERAGKIYAYARKYQANGGGFDLEGFLWLQQQLKQAEAEAREALKRAKYSGDKISRLVSGLRGDQLFEHLKGEVRFKAQTGFQQFTSRLEEKNPELLESNRYESYLGKVNKFLDESGT
jgi:hypothetical protein